MSALNIKYEKIDVYLDNCMLFWKEHANEKKCLKCGQSRFVKVVIEDGEKVTTKVAHKQLHYFSITPRLKRLFISKRTMRHMRWHKEGIRGNDRVMVHPLDGEAWKVIDSFDADFASDASNVRFGLLTGLCCSVQPTTFHCMKYEFMFLCFIVPRLETPGLQLINVMLKL
jgi:hypothetical protein